MSDTTNATNEQLAIFTQAVQASISRLQFARQHGMQYGGDRDVYRVGGYRKTLLFEDFAALYERDGIAGQIVDMPAETTWRTPPEVAAVRDEDEDESQTNAFDDAWQEMVGRLRLWQRFERADRLARLGRYSVILIGTSQVDDMGLQTPMGRLRGPDDVLYLSVYSEKHARIKTWVTDPRDPRYGLPETYQINLSSGVDDFQRARPGSGAVIVHHSRCIHIAENLLEDEVYGREALRRIFNDLVDLQKVSTGSAEAFWQRVAGILTAKIDPTMTGVDKEFLEGLNKELQKLYHDLNRVFAGQGIELDRLGDTEPRPKEAADLCMTKIAAGAGIPKRMLFGSETGERASSEDQKTFLGSIAERQQQHAEPMILRAFIDRLIEHGGLPRPGRNGYEIVWPALFQESEKEKAEANRSRAEAARALTPVGGDPLDLVEIDANRDVWLRPTGTREPIDLAERDREMEGIEEQAAPLAEDDEPVPGESGEQAA